MAAAAGTTLAASGRDAPGTEEKRLTEAAGAQQDTQALRLSTRVRTADRAQLEAVLFDVRATRRPTPAQFQAAGREARVVGVLLDAGEPLHRLDRLPGLWPRAWLQPVEAGGR